MRKREKREGEGDKPLFEGLSQDDKREQGKEDPYFVDWRHNEEVSSHPVGNKIKEY